ncbi:MULTISPECIES: hypothetical protein [unclassified Moorena]|uniref:hypothetical protein n=1 Tax=unclassified Moorena TaxID=2683338 RepID=UPI0013B6EFAF|nr:MULTISPECIES: hypothetical protein [unclassified Moorena]NEQ08159.1 hypothetical protein [Moorena sp. SIO4E2]NEQ17007.1 hypothetical protein [Moorena sp. SIO3E2]NER86034.1 hypothetical protein [Moorena sp. SIO3A2]NES41840.1 hypothetical protein [Moorena sp. SIO2C4]
MERASCPLQFPGTLSQPWLRGKKSEAIDPVVRYGAHYPNPGYEAKNQRLSAPNAPYATFAFCLLP